MSPFVMAGAVDVPKNHRGLIRFWGNGAASTFTDAWTIYPYHAVRMTDGGFGPPTPSVTDDGWGVLVSPYPSVEGQKTDFQRTNERRGGPKWPHLSTTKTSQQYMDTCRRKTARGQLGFPKTHMLRPCHCWAGKRGCRRKTLIPILKSFF